MFESIPLKSEARGRRLAVIQANKVRRLVLETVSLDSPME